MCQPSINESEALLELNNKVLFKDLKRVNYNSGNTTRQHAAYSEEKKKVESSYSKKHAFEKNQSCILSF